MNKALAAIIHQKTVEHRHMTKIHVNMAQSVQYSELIAVVVPVLVDSLLHTHCVQNLNNLQAKLLVHLDR